MNERTFAIVALTASAGGLQALTTVLAGLPADFPLPLLIVQHLAPGYASHLADILGRRCALRVTQATEGEQIQPAVVYIAPPNYHLLVNPGGILQLTQSEPIHFVRPAADCLFASVATSYPAQAIAVVLTGTGHDGAQGAQLIKQAGGVVVVQAPADAQFPGMPSAAILAGPVDFILPLAEIPPVLCTLVRPGGAA